MELTISLKKTMLIPDNTPLLTDLSNSINQANAVTIAPAGGASITNLFLPLNTLLIEGNGAPNYTYSAPGGSQGIFSTIDQTLATTSYTLVTNDNLANVIGNLASNDLLYGVSGNQINVSNGYNFVTSPDTLFGLTGNLNTTNGSITFNGPAQIGPLSNNVVTLQTNGGGNIETGNIVSATSNPYTLDLYSANNIYLNGLLLLRDSDHTGKTITDGSLNVSAAYTTQSISTNTIDDGYIVENFDLLQGMWLQNGGYANALGDFQINSGVMPSSQAEYLQIYGINTLFGSGTIFDPFIIQPVYGQGTPSDPYYINSIESLQGIGSDSYTLGSSYIFTGYSNANVSSLWNYDAGTGQYAGFVPIGTTAMPFVGSLATENAPNGISYIYINRPDMDNVGIFGVTGSSAVLSNVYLTKDAVTGNNNVGALVGLNQGTILDSMGDQNFVIGNDNVGSLVGSNSGSISNSGSFDSRVLGQVVGGLVGNNSGSIDQSIAAVYVGGLSNSAITGGLAGINTGTIQDSFWDQNVTGQTLAAGETSGTISGSYAGQYGGNGVDLTNPATYLTTADGGLGLVSTSWDLTNTWGIQPGISYPYISQIFDSQGTTPRIISGQLSPASANELLVQVWGIPINNNPVSIH